MTRPLRSRRPRRTAAAALVALAAGMLASPLLAPAPAHADDDATLTVVGTSDVFDSHLVQEVIKPGFEAANPGITLNYVSRGTGAAIAFAKAGTASAMIVHAAALENQFVADGYSAEPYGRAIFWGDYVLLGPASDPAGVLTNAPHDIVTAFERVAAAGEAGTANFVSRGGTPGTTVQEHAIWALTDGVQTCTVSAANGGGTSPSTSSGNCANPIPVPDWYEVTGQTQGPNILTGDACNGFESDACYVFTDRGTFNYLESTGSISDLDVVTRDNEVAGQLDLLVNSFHAYAINPAKFADNPNVRINTAGATKFLDYLTSPAAQRAIGAYLNAGTPSDPPFLPSAAPTITATPSGRTIRSGNTLAIAGKVTNEVPGTPALNGVPVKLLARASGRPDVPTVVATATTDAAGAFVFRYKPERNQSYFVATDSITKIQNADLDPDFGDILAANQVSLGDIAVQSRVGAVTYTPDAKGGTFTAKGTFSPKATTGARVRLYAGLPGNALTYRSVKLLEDGASSYNERFKLAKGRWTVELRYVNDGVVLPSATTRRTITLK